VNASGGACTVESVGLSGRAPADAILVRATGELDVATMPALRAPLERAVRDGARHIAVDLAGVTFMDSVTLAALIGVRERLAGGARLAIVATPGSYVRLVLEASGLVGIFDVFATEAEAVGFALG
jgi:anti-sigma B factor antagonist